MKVTVFTPTYNRKTFLETLFNSLKNQTSKDFEWIVVDDGSSDGTNKLFESFNSKEFNIKYIQVENGGKHRAINKGLELAKGEMFFIVDSDDYLKETAIEEIIKMEDSIKKLKGYCGVSGVRVYPSDEIIGGWNHDGEYIDCTNLERYENGLLGDKAEVYYTEILKKYKFPEIDGEKFLSERVVWDKIANDGYKIRWFNKKIYVCEYQEGGLTDSLDRLIVNNPKGYTLEMKNEFIYASSLKKKISILSQYLNYMDEKINKNVIIKEFGTNLFVYTTAKLMIKIKGKKEK